MLNPTYVDSWKQYNPSVAQSLLHRDSQLWIIWGSILPTHILYTIDSVGIVCCCCRSGGAARIVR